MDIDHLREFAYLAETLSFTATARHFFMSASVLDSHIASLENDLQVELFDYTDPNTSLTEDGEAFYRDIFPVIDGYDRAIANLEARRANSDLRLRIGYLRGAARPFLPKVVRHMEKAHPEIDLDLISMEYGELIRAHRSHAVDVIFNMDFDPDAVEACDSAFVYQDRLYVVVGRKHHLATRREGVVPEDLAGEQLLLPDEQEYPGLAQHYERVVGNVCDVSLAKRYKDIDTFYLRIAQNNYAGFSSGHNYRQFEGRAAFIPLNGVDMSYSVCAQWLKGCDGRIADIARELAEVCSEYMQGWSDGVSGEA